MLKKTDHKSTYIKQVTKVGIEDTMVAELRTWGNMGLHKCYISPWHGHPV